MSRSQADLAALHAELTNDPNALGLTLLEADDAANADKLNCTTSRIGVSHMKPSEIAARKAEIEAVASPLREQLKPLEEQMESLRQQKAAIVNDYGAKLRRLRDQGKMTMSEFATFRELVYAAPEDDRAAMIDSALAKHNLA